MTFTRQQVADTAMSLVNVPFRHQGRDVATGIDCVGLPYIIAVMLDYPHRKDIEGYRRVPSANDIRETLRANCDEIDVSEVKVGDIYLMRFGGIKPRHVAVKVSDETDLARGIEPMLVHAKASAGKVVVEPIRQWTKDFVCGFRMRGIKD